VLVLLYGGWQWFRYASGLTLVSDAEATERFHSHREIFERLRKMASEDKLTGRLALTYGGQDLGDERLREYRQLMAEAEIEALLRDGLGLRFALDDQDSVWGGRSKGIDYRSQSPKSPVLPSLDKSCRSLVDADERFCSGVRQIEGPWWLYREENR
jgi:hypothetical protein